MRRSTKVLRPLGRKVYYPNAAYSFLTFEQQHYSTTTPNTQQHQGLEQQSGFKTVKDLHQPLDTFSRRHLGSNEEEIQQMLKVVGESSLESLVEKTVPPNIRLREPLRIDGDEVVLGESDALQELHDIMSQNQHNHKSFIGTGYYNTKTPYVILRNIIENPGWYTPYTPYQAEIAQGRLESLLNFQTVCSDLTGLPTAVASLLDEATAGAEAMAMCFGFSKTKKKYPHFFHF